MADLIAVCPIPEAAQNMPASLWEDHAPLGELNLQSTQPTSRRSSALEEKLPSFCLTNKDPLLLGLLLTYKLLR